MKLIKALVLSSLMLPAACQNFGDMPSSGCVAGFAKTATGCRSLNTLSSQELNAENDRLDSLIVQDESQLNALKETKKMIANLKAAELSKKSNQESSDRAATENEKAPVPNLSSHTTASNTPKAAFNSPIFQSDIGFKDYLDSNNKGSR